MTTSKVASEARRESSTTAVTRLKEKFAGLKAGIMNRYKDSGTSGAEQQKKELAALEIKKKAALAKLREKQAKDIKSVKRYGKDAMKARTFASYSKGGMTNKSGNNDMRKGGMFK